ELLRFSALAPSAASHPRPPIYHGLSSARQFIMKRVRRRRRFQVKKLPLAGSKMCQLPDSRNPHHANFSVHDRAVSQENWLCSSFFEVRANAGRDTVPAPEKPSTGPPAKSKQADQRPR